MRHFVGGSPKILDVQGGVFFVFHYGVVEIWFLLPKQAQSCAPKPAFSLSARALWWPNLKKWVPQLLLFARAQESAPSLPGLPSLRGTTEESGCFQINIKV